MKMNGYSAITPDNPLPSIISPSGSTNIAAVKAYFGQEGTVKDIAQKVGIPYDNLISGDYVLLLEPVIYLSYNNAKYAMSATEAALYDRLIDGKLKAALGYATHQNLPLAMFLETPDLGYPAWDGDRSGVRTNTEIIFSLGLGTVRFREGACCGHPSGCACITDPRHPNDCACKETHPGTPCGPSVPGCDCTVDTPGGGGSKSYQYHTDTDVITTVTIRNYGNTGISPDDDAEVIFSVNGTRYRKPFVIPADEDTPIWIRWHTPSTPQVVTIQVTSTHGTVVTPTVVCRVDALEENPPPDPKPTNLSPGYRVPALPNVPASNRLTWGEWIPRWKENWQWVEDMDWEDGSHSSSCPDDCSLSHGEWVDNGQWEDLGKWEYDWREYSASLSLRSSVFPANEVPTAFKQPATGVWEMKSGYGTGVKVAADVSTNGSSGDVTVAQNAIAQFPEFQYQTYFRLLKPSRVGMSTTFSYKTNQYSFKGAPSHYTPLWFPDNSRYAPQMTVFDVWTPGGQLYGSTSDYLFINGDCYDDWNISPVK